MWPRLLFLVSVFSCSVPAFADERPIVITRVRQALASAKEASATALNVEGLRALWEAGEYSTIGRIQRDFCGTEQPRLYSKLAAALHAVTAQGGIMPVGDDLGRLTQELRSACTTFDGSYNRGLFIVSAQRIHRMLEVSDRASAPLADPCAKVPAEGPNSTGGVGR